LKDTVTPSDDNLLRLNTSRSERSNKDNDNEKPFEKKFSKIVYEQLGLI